MNKNYTVEEFVELWENGDLGVGDVIIKQYAPIIEKQTVLNTLIGKCISKDAMGIEYIDSFLLKVNFIAAVIILYTDLDINHDNDDRSFFDDYDLLVKNGIIDELYDILDRSELGELQSVYDVLLNNFRERNYSGYAFVSKLVKVFSEQIAGSSNALLEEIRNYINLEENK